MIQLPTVLLASKSPRRRELIKGLEFPYEIHTYDTDESFPETLKAQEIAMYLADKKAMDYPNEIHPGQILLTADTIVWVNGHVLNKPANEVEALSMLQEICGTTHEVFTGVTLRDQGKKITFFERSEVTCKAMTTDHLQYYINHYQPFDKAGSYGIQDWFGYTAVERINGCFYNVMGLPVSRVYEMIKTF